MSDATVTMTPDQKAFLANLTPEAKAALISEALGKVTATVDATRKAVDMSQAELKNRLDEQDARFKALAEKLEKARAKVRTPWGAGNDGAEERRSMAFHPDFSWTAAAYCMAHARGSQFAEKPAKDMVDGWIKRGHYPEAIERAMSGQIDTSGGFLIPDEYMTEIIPAFLPKVAPFKAGVRTLNVPAGVGQLGFPKQNARPTVTAITEAQAPTESTPTWQRVVFNPHGIGMLMAIPMQVLRYSNASIEAFIRDIIMKEMMVEWGRQVLRGLGSANELLGVLNANGITSNAVGVNGGAITYALITDLQTLVEESNAEGSKWGWITSPRGRREINQILDTQNRPLFHVTHENPGLAAYAPTSMLGYPVYTTTSIPVTLTKGSGTALTELYYALWEDGLFTTWGGVEVRESRDATDGTNNAFTMGLMLVVARQDADFSPFHGSAFGVTPDMNSA